MCELFALSSSVPAEVSFSLQEFSNHGGLTDRHKDGWGIAYYDDNDARIIKEADSASDSSYLRFIKDLKIKSKIILSHIRLATQGEISTRNTQPFSRELGGKRHVFIHNGDLSNFENLQNSCSCRFKPIGNTDSEQAFCYLMEKMCAIWDQKTPPSLEARQKVFEHFANKISALGIANFIYSDSEYIFVHSHKRISLEEEVLPGLYIICRHCSVEEHGKHGKDISGLQIDKTESMDVVLIASVPLCEAGWLVIPTGGIRIIQNGKVIYSAQNSEKQGGVCSTSSTELCFIETSA